MYLHTCRVSRRFRANILFMRGDSGVTVSCITGGSEKLTVPEFKAKKAVALRIYETSVFTLYVLLASSRRRSCVIASSLSRRDAVLMKYFM
jgi:hypothetical protein